MRSERVPARSAASGPAPRRRWRTVLVSVILVATGFTWGLLTQRFHVFPYYVLTAWLSPDRKSVV